MELRHLRYAVAVADALHFRRAAEQLNVSQPPLSQQIRQLEEELGTPLFVRSKRKVSLTAAGRLFIEEARTVLAQAEHARRVVARSRAGESGLLTIGVIGPVHSSEFIDLLESFGKRHPAVHIMLRNMLNRAEQIEALRDGRIHLGLVSGPIEDLVLTSELLSKRRMMIALPAGHRLARRSYVNLRELSQERHVLFSRHVSPEFFDAIAGACSSAGWTLNVTHEADNYYAATVLVSAGLGVCFVPEGFVDARMARIVVRPIRPSFSPVHRDFVLAYRRDTTSTLVPSFLTGVTEIRKRRRRPSKKT